MLLRFGFSRALRRSRLSSTAVASATSDKSEESATAAAAPPTTEPHQASALSAAGALATTPWALLAGGRPDEGAAAAAAKSQGKQKQLHAAAGCSAAVGGSVLAYAHWEALFTADVMGGGLLAAAAGLGYAAQKAGEMSAQSRNAPLGYGGRLGVAAARLGPGGPEF